MTQIEVDDNGRVAEGGRLFPHRGVTQKIIKSFYEVYNRLGRGFLEKLYERAMVIELEEARLEVETQVPATVVYKEHVIGEFALDLVVAGTVVVELKSVRTLTEEHAAQLINYLTATKYELGLLLNFGDKPEIRRILCTKEYKQH
jgi:GxxExxY protein